MYNGEQIAQFFNSCGVPCSFVDAVRSPKLSSYFLKIGMTTQGKIKNAVFNLSNELGEDVQIINGRSANYNLILSHNDNNFNFSVANIKTECNKFICGIDALNNQVDFSLDKAVHLLVAGTTGSGKSIFLKSLLYQICTNSSDIEFAIIDTKKELSPFCKSRKCKGIATDERNAEHFVKFFGEEMRRRYDKMEIIGTANASGYFKKWVLVVDELADLLFSANSNEIKTELVKIAQLGRAAGIHLVLATQTPRAKILDGVLLANLPTRCIFKTASSRESVLCLGHGGADALLGAGDMIFQFCGNETRLQAPDFTSEQQKIFFN